MKHRAAAHTVAWLSLLFAVLSPINSVAGGSDFTFNPGSVSLAAVIGTETASQDVEVTNESGKALRISGITIELDSTEFSEINSCHTEILPGQAAR
jgi:hypothetical protein